MLVLAIDATTRVGGFALARDGEAVASRMFESEKGVAAALFGEVEALLTEAGIALAEVDAFAALAGPGSFTGIRVGLAAVKALGEACGKPVVAVSNLEALAFLGEGGVRAVALPGRGGDVFCAIFDGSLRPLVSERQEPAEMFAGRAREAGARMIEGVSPLAEAAARLVSSRGPGDGATPEAADANYVERPTVEKNAKA